MKSAVDSHHDRAKELTRIRLWMESWSQFFDILRRLAKDPAEVFDAVAAGKIPTQPHFVEQLAYASLALGVLYQPVAYYLALPHFSLLAQVGDMPQVVLFVIVLGLLLLVLPLVVSRLLALFFFVTCKIVGGRGTFELTRFAGDLADAPLILLGLFLSLGSGWLALASILLDYLLTVFAMSRIHRKPVRVILLGQLIGLLACGSVGGVVLYLTRG